MATGEAAYMERGSRGTPFIAPVVAMAGCTCKASVVGGIEPKGATEPPSGAVVVVASL